MKKTLLTLLLACVSLSILKANDYTDPKGNNWQFSVKDDGTAELTSCSFAESRISIPETVEYEEQEYAVTSIGESAFAGSGIESISFPANIAEIGARAFCDCGSLNFVDIPSNSSLITIGEEAFYNCGSLPYIVLPSSLQVLGKRAFSDVFGFWHEFVFNSLDIDQFAPYAFASGRIKCPESAAEAYRTKYPYMEIVTAQATNIYLDIEEIKLPCDFGYGLGFMLEPEGDVFNCVRWTSSDENVATVDPYGGINTYNEGTTIITAETIDGSGLSATCVVTVGEVSVDAIWFPFETYQITKGSAVPIDFSYSPDYLPFDYEITSSDETVVRFEEEMGQWIAVSEGTATITLTSRDNPSVSATCTVIVSNVAPTKWTVSYSDEMAGFMISDIGSGYTLAIIEEWGNFLYPYLGSAENYCNIADAESESPVSEIETGVKYIINGLGTFSFVDAQDGTYYIAYNGNLLQQQYYEGTISVVDLQYDWNGMNVSLRNTASAPQSLTASVWGCPEDATSWEIPESVEIEDESYPVTAIIDYGFENTNLTYLSVPASVTTIGSNAFCFNDREAELVFENPDPSNYASDMLATLGSNVTVKVLSAGLEAYQQKYPEVSFVASDITYDAAIEEIILDPLTLEGYIGETYKISATIVPADANPSLDWESSDEEIATVDKRGNVTFVGIGTATITATSKENSDVAASCQATTKIVPIEGISFSMGVYEVTTGASVPLELVFTPENSTYQDYQLSSSNENVVRIDGEAGAIAVSAGTAIITATAGANSELTATCTVQVCDFRPTRWIVIYHQDGGYFTIQEEETGNYFRPYNNRLSPTFSSSHKLKIRNNDNTNQEVSAIVPGTLYSLYSEGDGSSSSYSFYEASNNTYYFASGEGDLFQAQGNYARIINDSFTDGDWSYSIRNIAAYPNQLTATITSYSGNDVDVIVPDAFSLDNGLRIVTAIGSDAFSHNENLRSIVLPQSLVIIGSSAFDNCSSLTSVDNLSACTSIGDYAFRGCSSLASVDLSACTSIDFCAFGGCSSLTSVDLPACTSIGSWAFRGCSSLTSVGNLSACLSIGDWAFGDCSSLSSVDYLSACTSIGNHAFDGCSSLTSFTIPANVTMLGNNAFYNCTGIKNLTIKDSSTSLLLGGNSDHDVWGGYTGLFGDCSLEKVYLGRNLESEYGAFQDQKNLIEVTVSKNVTSINRFTFYGCSSLESIDLSSCTSIEQQAFDGCSSLTSVDLSSCTSIGVWAFGDCKSLLRLELPASDLVTLDSPDAFSLFTTIFVPDNLLANYKTSPNWEDISSHIVAIGSEPAINQHVTMQENFSGLHNAIGEKRLASVIELKVIGDINSYDIGIIRDKMPNLHILDLSEARIRANDYCYYGGVCSSDDILGDFAFYDLPKLLKVVLPDNITEIGNSAFYGCSNLEEVNIPNNATRIGENAFSFCGLRKILIPAEVINIESLAFYECGNLQSVLIAPESKLKYIYSAAFAGCHQLQEVHFTSNSSLTHIDYETFFGCSNLKSIDLPSSVEYLGDYIFGNCSGLTEIYLPTAIKYIGNFAFDGCTNLRKVYTSAPLAEDVTIGDETFDAKTRELGTLYVPLDEETGWNTTYYSYYYQTQWKRLNIDQWCPEYDRFPINNDYEQFTGTIPGESIDAQFGTNAGYILGEEAEQEFETAVVKTDNAQSGSIIALGDDNLHIGELYSEIEVVGKQWYFFCFPFDIEIERINCGDAQYVFRKYDGEERAKGKSGWKILDSNEQILKAGVGYIFQANQDGILALPVDNPNFADCESPQLVAHTANSNADASWNFVGNPYLSYYQLEDLDFDAPVTYWNGSSYEAVRAGDDDYAITPYQAFFVQKTSDSQEVGFDADKQMTSNQTQKAMTAARERRARQRINPNRLLINVTITDGENTDRTRVVYNNEKSAAYEAECDAAKFMSTESVPQLYTVMGGVQYAINERPQGEVSLGYKAVKAGTYSIAMARMDTPMLLKDLKTGETFDFTIGQAYTFNSEAGTFNDRFVLVQNSAINRIENMTVADAETPAFFNLAGQRTNGEGDAIQIMMQGENAKKVMIR